MLNQGSLCLVERSISFVSVMTRMCGGSPYFPCMMFNGSSLESRRPLTLTVAMRNSSGLICGVWCCLCWELHGIADLLNLLGVELVTVAAGAWVICTRQGGWGCVIRFVLYFFGLWLCPYWEETIYCIRGVPSKWRSAGRLHLPPFFLLANGLLACASALSSVLRALKVGTVRTCRSLFARGGYLFVCAGVAGWCG
jgi:hypothetical protein